MTREPMDALLKRLQWSVLRPLATRFGGDERSVLRGPGMEVTEVREYQPGDDVRHIDWNVTARAGGERPYVREAQVERALDVWLLVDVSASVDWGTARCLKRDLAAEFTAVSAALLGRHGNRVGALLFAARPLGFVPPGSGRRHLYGMLSSVREEPRQQARGRTDLAAALVQAQSVATRRALVLVISDFLVAEGWQEPLRRLALRHEVVAVALKDPREADLVDVGLVTFEDPETGDQLVVDTGDARLRERFAIAAQVQFQRLQADLTRCGVDLCAVNTGEELVPALVHFLELRRRARRQPPRGRALSPVFAAG